MLTKLHLAKLIDLLLLLHRLRMSILLDAQILLFLDAHYVARKTQSTRAHKT
jgi:hypothetical protein